MLSNNQKIALRTAMTRQLSNAREEITGTTKQNLLDAITAVDDWIDANSVSFNSSLPAGTGQNLSNRQKMQLLLAVARAQWEAS